MASAEFIPLSTPVVRGNEWTYVKECLDTAWVSSVGSYVNRFEEQVAQRAGTEHAIATVNGTAALHIAMLLAGVRPGDEVIVPAMTFIAPVNTIRYIGAHPVFVDSEPEYWQMDPAAVTSFLEDGCEQRDGELINRNTGREVKAIVPVHILGHPVDHDTIAAAANKAGIPVIEDATESLGARYKGRPVGSLGEIACFSFNGNKIITTGGGGMLVTDNAHHAERARYLTTQAKDDPLEYIHGEVGYNYRLTNVLAAIGVAQLEQLDAYITRKREIAKRYRDALGAIPGVTVMKQAPRAESIFWLFTILIDEEITGVGSRELLRRLGDARIQTRPLWQPIHKSPAYPEYHDLSLPVAERLNRQALSLPCSVNLTDQQQDRVIQEILSTLSR